MEKLIEQECSKFDLQLLIDVSKYRKEYFVNKTTEEKLSKDGGVKINITNNIENSPYCQSADFINSSANELFLKQIDEILYS